MAYYAQITSIEVENLTGIVVGWSLAYETGQPPDMVTEWATTQQPIRMALPEGGTRQEVIRAIRGLVLETVKPIVDRHNKLQPIINSHLAALRTALVGERYPEA